MKIWIIDTSVIVSALISKNPALPPRQILQRMRHGKISFLLSSELLKEYREVLQRPKICTLHGLNEVELNEILATLTLQAHWCEPIPCHDAPDKNDNHLWALLKAIPDSTLVTGDKLLIDNPPEFAQVISPRDFISHEPPKTHSPHPPR